MSRGRTLRALPEPLLRYFWDLESTASRHRETMIVRRLLEIGGWDAVVMSPRSTMSCESFCSGARGDLPIIVEVVATEEDIQAVLSDLDTMIDGGLITLERARVIMYRPHDVVDDARWQHRIEGLDPEGSGAHTT